MKIKLAALKAKVPSVKPSKAKPVTPNPEPSTEPEPPTNIDCMIFMAFDQLVGLVDDYDRMANCWRQAMHTIEQHLSGCVTLVREHPEPNRTCARSRQSLPMTKSWHEKAALGKEIPKGGKGKYYKFIISRTGEKHNGKNHLHRK